MTPEEFEKKIRSDLAEVTIELIEIFNRRGYLCVRWKFENYPPFLNVFRVSNEFLAEDGDKVVDLITSEVVLSLVYPEKVVASISTLWNDNERKEAA